MTNYEKGNPLTEYDLHGVVAIRLIGDKPADRAAVSRQLGPISARLNRDPDITIRFVDKLPIGSSVRYLDLDDSAFTKDAFLVLRSRHKIPARVQIPFERIGQTCEIVCERGLPAVPLLLPILNLTALSKGVLPLHASAFVYQGKGVLVTGWAKGGKTETLLAFMANGAEYVGDEWIYIGADGQHMFGIPEPIRLWNWQLDCMPQYRARVSRWDRARLRTLSLIVKAMEWASMHGLRRGWGFARLVNRLLPILKRQLSIQVPPEKLFRQEVDSLAASLDKVFFVASHESSQITLEPINSEEIAQRMVFSLQEERADLLSYYLKFRFAFPNLRNELIERAEQCQRERLMCVMAGKEAYAVYHPYPVSIPALFETMKPEL